MLAHWIGSGMPNFIKVCYICHYGCLENRHGYNVGKNYICILLFPSAIPALQPIVHDLFVLRGSNKADAGKELDTQKEVVVSMLLRLVQYHQVWS